MKYIKIIFFLCVFFTLFTPKTSAQNNKINVAAVVVDAQGKVIPGAVITNDKDGAKAISNQSGEFTIALPTNGLLSVKAVGYETYSGSPRAELKSIVLKQKLNQLVQVAFNSVDKADLLGGVSTKDIVPLLESNFYTGSLDNLSSYIPGYGSTIWGQNGQLVLVDGVPRDQYNVIPSEIDQITVLKSAAAVALYGSRAAKGVVSITTKRGGKNENKFKVRVNTGISVPKRYAQYLNSADYLTLKNEAITNDGTTSGITSQDVIDKYRSGKYPIRYPNIDFYSSDYIKKYATRNDVTAEYTGGNDRAKFYVNVGTYNTTTLLNYGNAKGEGENRFNLRANLDLKLNDFITSRINSSLTFYDNKNGNTASNNPNNGFWASAATYIPANVGVAPFIPLSYLTNADASTKTLLQSNGFLIDGQNLISGTSTYPSNTFADLKTKGYTLGTTRKYQFDASLNFNLSSILKGLSFDTQFAIDYNTSYQTTIGDNTYTYYIPGAWSSDSTITTLTRPGTDAIQYSRNIYNSYQQQTLFFSGAFKYKNTFDKVHNVSALLLAHAYQQQESQVYHATAANANLGLQVGYNYKQKYYIDFTGNVVHSAKLAAGHRDEFSPTVSLGWTLSNEDFLAKSDVVNFLKLTGSAGIVKTDLDFTLGSYAGYYMYQSNYVSGGGWSWQENRGLTETNVRVGDNPNLAFEQRKEITLGFEASLFNNSLQVSGSYYNNLITGIPISNVNLFPNYMNIIVNGGISTSFVPYVNYNEDQRQGFDLGINYIKKIGQVDLNVGAVVSYYDTKANLRNEVDIAEAYRKGQGKPLDAIWGLKSAGFYDATSVAAINGSPQNPTPTFGGTIKPGDLRYVDQNGDGKIDSKDYIFLGKGGNWGAPLNLALNFTAKWNNFSLFVLANSQTGAYSMKSSSYYWAYGVNAKYTAPMLGRWTPATAATATYPRLTQTTGANNFQNSDFWLYKIDRISLARVQLSYDIPKKLLAKTFISDLGVYINGNDLLLIAKEKETMETNIGSAPQMRYYSVGLKVAF